MSGQWLNGGVVKNQSNQVITPGGGGIRVGQVLDTADKSGRPDTSDPEVITRLPSGDTLHA